MRRQAISGTAVECFDGLGPVGPSWNGSLVAGASTGFGFTVAKNGSGAVPAAGTRTAS